MSESVACALEMISREKTRETRKFIRMIDIFFNVRGPKVALLKRKDILKPYTSPIVTKDNNFITHTIQWRI